MQATADPMHGLSPCELQDHVWVKMSAVAAGVSKKRKKSDTKPQAQINKCNNEKRRREQENIYIEELAELISASFADMSSLSVKPDKCAILHETVNQIKRIREQERSRTPAISASVAAAVQQGEVSSSRPADILTSGDLAPLLLEALEGFLLIVSRDGRIEQCSSNIEKYIKYTYDEVVHQELFNFIHLGDTARFSSILKPPLWSEADPPQNRSFTCRFLVKPPDDRDAPLDERQQRIDKYEQMHICSAEVLYPPNDENAETCLMCIARRIPQAEKAATATSSVVAVGGVSATGAFDQFSTKLDTDGKIESIDTSAVSSTYAPHIHKRLVGIRLAELCIPADASRLAAHLRDTIDSGATRTSVFRLRLTAPSKQHVSVQTTSKFFKCELDEYIMSTHFIIGVSDLDETESSNLSIGEGGNNSNSTTPVGGPLMTSVMNGAASVATPSPRVLTPATTASGSLGTPTPSYNLFSSDHELFFPTSTWDMDLAWGDANVASTSRPGSRHSAVATPVSTPTPSLPSASPCMPSPLQSFSQPQPSPVANTANPATPSSQFPPNFPFSPLNDTLIKLEDSSSKENMDESMNDSGRLRNLLTNNNTKRVSDMATNCNPSGSTEDDGRNKNRILKGLLNQDDDDESKEDSKISLRGLIGNLVASGSSQLLNQDQPKTSTGNNMLLSLLNDKSDDDDVESRAGLAKPSELLQRLMKGPEEDRKQAVLDSSSQDDLLLRNLGFTNSPSPPGRKRSSDEATAGDEADHQNKRSASDQVSSTGNSKLWEKNKMLASLLAKQPSSTPIPTLPARVISATPQELPRVGDARKMGFVFNKDVYNTTTTTTATTSTRGRAPGRPVNSMYLNQIMMNSGVNNALGQNINNNNNVSAADMNSRVPTSIRNEQGFSGPMPNISDMWGDTQNDPILSDLLDQVIDIVPDAYVTDSSTIMNILDALEAPQNNNIPQLNEKMAAINAIQKSLMQCESAVKSPPSPNMSMGSGTPPAYSINSSSSFPPPPGYSQQQQQQRARFTGVRNNPQYAVAGSNLTQQQQLLLQQQQRTKLFQQQEQKRRLLQQQQQQQLLIPSNATAAELNSPLTNINSLMNTTVAPNVSLQRSSSVPDSPVYNMNQQRLQQQPQAQAPFSPTYTSQQTGNQYQGGSRLSPHSANTRPPVSMYQPSTATSPQQGAWGTAQSPSQQTQQTRLGLSQQQNPMLNAQLTGAGYQNRPYTNVQRPGSGQRSGSVNMVGSPSSASPVSRQSPYQSSDGYTSNSGGGPPNARSPTPPYTTSYQQQLQHRLQRTISAPSATTHLPGGLGSPRHYHAPPVPPSPYSPPQHGYDTMQPPQYCYDQTGLQLVYNGADRGRAPPPPPGGGSNAINSEYVRQELRAVVGARTASVPQQQQQQGRSASSGGSTQQQVTPQLPGQPQVSAEDFEALGLTFEMPPTGASDSPKLWGTMGSNELGSPPQASAALSSSSSRSIMEETAKPGDQKSSLLQKLLSE